MPPPAPAPRGARPSAGHPDQSPAPRPLLWPPGAGRSPGGWGGEEGTAKGKGCPHSPRLMPPPPRPAPRPRLRPRRARHD